MNCDPFRMQQSTTLKIAISMILQIKVPASWSGINAFVSGAVGLRFKSRASQIKYRVATAATFRKELCGRV